MKKRIFYFVFTMEGKQKVYCETCAKNADGIKIEVKLKKKTADSLVNLLTCGSCRAEYPFEPTPELSEKWLKKGGFQP